MNHHLEGHRMQACFDELPELLTVEEWRDWARVGRSAAYELVASKQIPALRIGKLIRIPKSTLLAK